MRPMGTPLEAAQAREIEQLKSELAHYRKQEERGDIVPVWIDAHEIEVRARMLPDRIYCERVALAEVNEEFDGYHVKAKTRWGLQTGYFLSHPQANYSPAIQAEILRELIDNVTWDLSETICKG